jgi:hypothetical protein
MDTSRMKSLLLLVLLFPAAAMAGSTVYRCPGPPVLYTDSLTPQEAKEKNCRTVEGAPVTVMQMPKPKPVASTAPRGTEARVEPGEQKARDSEARRILEAELRKEEERLAELQKDYNNGEPERRGDERNYQKYLDRVAGMKAAIERKEADVAALKRELAKLPAGSSGER